MKKFASSVLYVLSIVLAVGIGMFQVGGTSNPVLPLGSGGPGCGYDGYGAPISCKSPCTAGEYKMEKFAEYTDSGDFRDDGSTAAHRGNCTGDIDCDPPKSIGLSSGPCAG